MNTSIINRAAVKRYALYVAKSSRAHTFTRVAKSFLDDVEARVESTVRRIGISTTAPLPADKKLFTPLVVEKFREVIDTHIRAVVSEKIRQMPSAGKTLI